MNWFQRRRQERDRRRNEDAKRKGYGWAWAAYRLEGKSLDEIEGYVWRATNIKTTEQMFDLGVELALIDIRTTLTLRLLVGETPSGREVSS